MGKTRDKLKLNLDCRYFMGEKPCKYGRLCEGCSHYEQIGYRILVIKQAALGDVLRTTSILPGLKRKYPDSHITWLTAPRAVPLLLNNLLVDRIYAFGPEVWARLQVEEFDEVICLDKEPSSTAMATLARIKDKKAGQGKASHTNGSKKGFFMKKEGNVFPANREADYAFALGISDDLKFKKNKKTYQQLIYEIAGLEYKKDEYVFNLTEEEVNWAKHKFMSGSFKIVSARRKYAQPNLKSVWKPNVPTVGLNIGSDEVFTGKSWCLEGFVELAEKVYHETQANILILGGPGEKEKNKILLKKVKVPVIDTGCENSLRQFSSIVNLCDLIVAGDTLCLHIGIALKKKTVAIFASTCAQEIDLYGRGKFIISPAECGPCYKRECPRSLKCMELIEPKSVYLAVKELLD